MRMLGCPRHARVMDTLHVAPKDEGERIELDRCATCGGLWFDAGELEVVAELTTRSTHERADLQCPVCRVPFFEVTLTGQNHEAHRCDTCFGMWLDGDTVKSLARPDLPRAPERVTFTCVHCSAAFPFTQGNATKSGLVCRDCAKKSFDPGPERQRRGYGMGDLDGEGLGDDAADAVWATADFLGGGDFGD